MRVEREKNRTCEACFTAKETFLITFGMKWVRACHDCLERVQELRFRVVSMKLDAAEKR